MNVSWRHIIVSLVLITSACARPRDITSRFRGAITSVDVVEIPGRGRVVLWNREPDAITFTQPIVLPPSDRTMCVYASIGAPFEVSWDGRPIGRSGTPGPMDNFFAIPRELSGAGPHVMTFHIGKASEPNFHGIAVGDLEQMLRSRIVAQVIPLSGFVLFLVIGVFHFGLWLTRRSHWSLLLFALLCFAASMLAVAETWRWTVGYTWDMHELRLQAINGLTFSVAILLSSFFISDLIRARKRVWLTLNAIVMIIVAAWPDVGNDERCLTLLAASLITSAVAFAFGRKTLAAGAALAVLFAALVSGGYGFSDNGFFIAFCFVIACLLISLAVEIRAERRAHDSALLRAARLEVELLQKTIQPHFVMNTLTAVMGWIEENPAEGLKLLESFADELRLFSAISRNAAIPLSQEIELCQAHLAVMSRRKEKQFSLRTESVDPAAMVPPAIFHTLVENAITHNRYDSDVGFLLSEERRGPLRRYVFDAPLAGTSHRKDDRDGTGLRYVKARLEEVFPGAWALRSEPSGANWRTTIEVRA